MGARPTVGDAKKQLRRVVEHLESIEWQLRGILLSLPEPAEERVRLEEVGEEMDAATALRATIACVLDDDLRPALQDLHDAVDVPEDDPGRAVGEP